MRCDEVARILPEAVDSGAAVELSVQRHIETCLRCQAELARYRKMLRGLQLLRTRYLEPAPGLRAILSCRRLAYVGAIGGAAVAAGTAATVMIVHRSRRRGAPATT
jgi:anti-sigma factor RsiW